MNTLLEQISKKGGKLQRFPPFSFITYASV